MLQLNLVLMLCRSRMTTVHCSGKWPEGFHDTMGHTCTGTFAGIRNQSSCCSLSHTPGLCLRLGTPLQENKKRAAWQF